MEQVVEISKETPREKFLRLAPPRVEAALKRIALIGNLATSGYQSEPDESRQIIDELQDAVDALKAKFEKPKAGPAKKGFTFAPRRR